MLPNFNTLPLAVKYNYARSLLMTSERATPPTHRAVLKTLGRIKRGELPGSRTWGPWRRAKAVKAEV
jgi:hypothetical protein